MKEYIRLGNYRVNKSNHNWILSFYKDPNRIIIHREKDKPARIWSDGLLQYYKNNKLYSQWDVMEIRIIAKMIKQIL
jgi:hypothetical protein